MRRPVSRLLSDSSSDSGTISWVDKTDTIPARQTRQPTQATQVRLWVVQRSSCNLRREVGRIAIADSAPWAPFIGRVYHFWYDMAASPDIESYGRRLFPHIVDARARSGYERPLGCIPKQQARPMDFGRLTTPSWPTPSIVRRGGLTRPWTRLEMRFALLLILDQRIFGMSCLF